MKLVTWLIAIVLATSVCFLGGCREESSTMQDDYMSKELHEQAVRMATPPSEFQPAKLYVFDGSLGNADTAVPGQFVDGGKSMEHRSSAFIRIVKKDLGVSLEYSGDVRLDAQFRANYTVGIETGGTYYLAKSDGTGSDDLDNTKIDIELGYGTRFPPSYMKKIQLNGRAPGQAFREEVPNRSMWMTQGMPDLSVAKLVGACRTLKAAEAVLRREHCFALYLEPGTTGELFTPRYLGMARPFQSLTDWPVKTEIDGKTLYLFKEFVGGTTYLGPWVFQDAVEVVSVQSTAGAISKCYSEEEYPKTAWINSPPPSPKKEPEF